MMLFSSFNLFEQILLFGLSYAIGMIPLSTLCERIFGNPAKRSSSKNRIIFVLLGLLNFIKGILPVILITAYTPQIIDPFYPAIPAGFFLVLGHYFPVWPKSNGERGIAVMIGALAFSGYGLLLSAHCFMTWLIMTLLRIKNPVLVSAALTPVFAFFAGFISICVGMDNVPQFFMMQFFEESFLYSNLLYFALTLPYVIVIYSGYRKDNRSFSPRKQEENAKPVSE